MKIAILGFARDGQAAYQHWNTPDNQITVCDADPSVDVPNGAASQLGPNYLNNLDQFDLLVRSAGLPPSKILAANSEAPELAKKITGNVDEFFRCSPTKNIIGVTGTKGKGTTCTLLAKMLEAAGKRVHLAGNIGIPALELLKNDIRADDWVVLEQSSFQLIDQQSSPHIAVCLMVVPEHQDWHDGHDEYYSAKQQLFARQTAQDLAIYNANNPQSQQIASASPGRQIPYMKAPGACVDGSQIVIDGQAICQVSDVKLLGAHNLQNVCAALTAFWQVSQDATAARQAITSFAGLPFRLELRQTVNDVKYYNDSFSSVPDATAAAIQAINEPKVLLVGGQDRGLDLNHLAKALQDASSQIRKVILYGASAKRTAQSLQQAGFSNYQVSQAKTMDEIVKEASQQAQAGDAVVLSPGFPSFDMFKDFEDRGQQFNQAVKQL